MHSWLWLIVPGILLVFIFCLWILLEHSIFPQKSTIAFWNLSGLPVAKKLEGYFYGARSSWYLKPATWSWFMHSMVKNESADGYHGKVISKEDAGKLIMLKQSVLLNDLEHVIPYPVARSIILQDPLPSLAVMQCPCRAQKKNPCQPVDVCLVVGEPFASFSVEHQPGKARKISVDEALAILDGEEKRGHIHTAWFKDVMHNRFYAICNCCSCCCLGMKSFSRGVPRLTHSGYSPQIDIDSCKGCGNCAQVCLFSAIQLDDEIPIIDVNKCMGCGLCVSHCPFEAISLNLAPELGIPLNIDRLVQ